MDTTTKYIWKSVYMYPYRSSQCHKDVRDISFKIWTLRGHGSWLETAPNQSQALGTGIFWNKMIHDRLIMVTLYNVYCIHSLFVHSFRWHVHNANIPCHSQWLLPFLSVIYPFPPTSLPSPSFQLAIYFLVYLSALLFPNSSTILFWEFCFLPFSLHAQTNVTYLTLFSVIVGF
jgi:hypothetical protein